MKAFHAFLAPLLLFFTACAEVPASDPPWVNPVILSDYTSEVYAWFVSSQDGNALGLVPSCEGTESDYSVSLYDQALSAMAFLVMGDITRSRKVLDYFNDRVTSELKSGLGGYNQFRSRSGVVGPDQRWLGDNAYMLAAVCNYAEITGDTDRYAVMQTGLEQWIRSLQDPDDGGLFYGSKNGVRDTLKILEGNIDAFGAVYAAGADDPFHRDLLAYFGTRWDPVAGLFDNWPGTPWNYACDTISWAYCAIDGFPEATFPKAEARFKTKSSGALNHADIYGFCFDEDRDTIHPEATMSMVAAYLAAGQTVKAEYYIKESEKLMLPGKADAASYGLPYASVSGTSYGSDVLAFTPYTDRPWVSSSAWYLFAKKNFNPLGYARSRIIPEADRFWE